MMQNGSCSIFDQRFLYEKYKSEFEEGGRQGVLDLQQIEEDLFNHIVWAPRIWRPWGFLFDCIERPNELGFPYWSRSFRGKRIIYDEEDELQENDEEMSKGLLTSQMDPPTSIYKRWRHSRRCSTATGRPPAPCDHADESCVAHAVGNLCQTFLLSYGIRVGIGILLRAFKLARLKSYSSLLDIKVVFEIQITIAPDFVDGLCGELK
ncbi:hypothetical protein SASPL_123415 [Salvia splendens]|uniref:Uncharacterized protein n=1 Tax=Salvia splendens TaxID=180675 RepID=A0A8X8ZTX9_SALSN|nr:hypothetical protein SASPL_123415 [Salvia splendens]